MAKAEVKVVNGIIGEKVICSYDFSYYSSI